MHLCTTWNLLRILAEESASPAWLMQRHGSSMDSHAFLFPISYGLCGGRLLLIGLLVGTMLRVPFTEMNSIGQFCMKPTQRYVKYPDPQMHL